MKTVSISPRQAQEVLKNHTASGNPMRVKDMVRVAFIFGEGTKTSALLNTGARLYRIQKKRGPANYWLLGYAQDGSDVTSILRSL